jgi:hypothetical protein
MKSFGVWGFDFGISFQVLRFWEGQDSRGSNLEVRGKG